jgi:hypothetical protein
MNRLPLTLGLLIITGALAACGRSGNSATDPSSALEREAEQVVMAEIHKHWGKGPDGLTTALWEGTSFAPVNFLRQYKEISLRGVKSRTLDESDKLNGVEFAGTAIFNESPAREAGDDGLAFQGLAYIHVNRGKGRWTQWINMTPLDLRVSKVKGQWQVATDNTLVSGRIPTPADYANAGIK